MRTRRAEAGLSMRELASQIGVHPLYLHRLERGMFARTSADRLLGILNVIGISPDEIPFLADRQTISKGNHVFISYSHKDTEYLERLMVHLKPLERQGIVDTWVDTKIVAGNKWKQEIEKALKKARVAILLVSADFLASDFIVDNELPPLLKKADEEGTTILPMVLMPCRFARDQNLREFQAINAPDEPVGLMSENEREVIYDAVAHRIERLLAAKPKG